MSRPVGLPAASSSGTDSAVVAMAFSPVTVDRFSVAGDLPVMPVPHWKFQPASGEQLSWGAATSWVGLTTWPVL